MANIVDCRSAAPSSILGGRAILILLLLMLSSCKPMAYVEYEDHETWFVGIEHKW